MQASETSFGEVVKQSAAQELTEALYQNFVPVFSYVQQGEGKRSPLLEKQISGMLSLYGYYNAQKERTYSGERTEDNYLSLEDILLAEAKDEGGVLEEEEPGLQNHAAQAGETNQNPEEAAQNSLEELLKAENEAAREMEGTGTEGQNGQIMTPASAFVPHTLQKEVDLREMANYETLVKNFYTIDNNTMAGSDQLDITKLLGKDMTISMEGEGPQILIYHTHSQEAFSNSVPGDEATSIVGVGEHLTEILTAQYGYRVLHHTGKYDVEARDDAYSKALPGIEQVLAENPSIQVVIDLHRDEMAEETRLVMDLDGRPTARFMFFNGLSRTKKTGNIAYLYNENQADNLAFSFQMQLKATEYYPGLVRKIYLKGYRYNMHLRPRTLLIELGAQNNTVEEAMNACDPIAHILDMVLSGEQ